MGIRPAPKAIKIAKGTPACRTNLNEPEFEVDGDATPPAHLGELGKTMWAYLFPELLKKGVLKMTDRLTLELYCEAYQDYRTAKAALDKLPKITITKAHSERPHVLVGLKRHAMVLILKYAGELGLTPSSRTRLVGAPATGKPGSSLKDFMRAGMKDVEKGS